MPCPRRWSTPCSTFGAPRPGEPWWDLYAGAGPVRRRSSAEAVAPTGAVVAVEASTRAMRAARRAAARPASGRPAPGRRAARGWPRARPARTGSCSTRLRSGAGAAVVDAICPHGYRQGSSTWPATRWPSAATSRVFAGHGYRVRAVRSFDAFPMTHHLETVLSLGSARDLRSCIGPM